MRDDIMRHSKSKVLIPADYITGGSSLELCYPYLVPEAIVELENICKPTMTVGELGAGGSSLFFGKRCKSVISLETSAEWAKEVQKRLNEEKLRNVKLILEPDYQKYLQIVRNWQRDSFDIILVDSDPNVTDRRELLKTCLSKVRVGGLIVLDNARAFGCGDFPNFMRGWLMRECKEYRWVGDSTVLMMRPSA